MEPHSNDGLKKSTASGMFWTLSEQLCSRTVSFLVSIVLARLLLPEDYSIVSIVAIFFAVCSVFISGGLNTALIQKKNADELDYSTVLLASLAVALVMYAGMFASAPLIAGLYAKPLLIPVIRVMGLTFFIGAFKSVLSAYTSSHLQFRKFFFSTIIGTVISAFVGIAMALKGFGAWALVAQEMTNSFIDTMILFLTTRLKIRIACSVNRLRGLFSYGSKNFFSSLINTVYNQLTPMIVGLRFSTKDLAFYYKGRSFPDLVNYTLASTISAVLFPVISKVQDNLEDVRGITRRYIKTASYLFFPVMLGLFAVSDSMVTFILTEKWLPAAPYIRIFCVSYMFHLVAVGNIQAVQAIGRSDVVLILEIITKVLSVLTLVLFLFYSRSPEILALSSAVSSIMGLVINAIPNRKLIGYRFRWQLADILPNLLLSTSMCVVVMLAGKIPLPTFPLLAVQVLTGVVVYVLLSIVTKNESFRYILDYGKQLLKRG